MDTTRPHGALVRIARSSDAAELAVRCRVADTPRLRLVGLLGRSGLDPGEGLLLRRSGSIHMFFMRFAIDAVFLDRDDTVVRVAPDLRPWRVAAARGARSVLELPAGTCAGLQVAPGDQLIVDAVATPG